MKRILVLLVFLLLLTSCLYGCSSESDSITHREIAELYFQAVQEGDFETIASLSGPEYIADLKSLGSDMEEEYSRYNGFYRDYQGKPIKSRVVLSETFNSPAKISESHSGAINTECIVAYEVTFTSGETIFVVQVYSLQDEQWYIYGTVYSDTYEWIPVAFKEYIPTDCTS